MNEINGKIVNSLSVNGNEITFYTNEGKYVYRAVAAYGREAMIQHMENTHVLINRKIRNVTGSSWNPVLWTNHGSAEFSVRDEWGYEAWFNLVDCP
jgi:hypothetical protein